MIISLFESEAEAYRYSSDKVLSLLPLCTVVQYFRALVSRVPHKRCLVLSLQAIITYSQNVTPEESHTRCDCGAHCTLHSQKSRISLLVPVGHIVVIRTHAITEYRTAGRPTITTISSCLQLEPSREEKKRQAVRSQYKVKVAIEYRVVVIGFW
jgi:hypothetical protein